MTAIHQLVAGFSRGDAISNEALMLRRIFRSWGFASEIYSERRRILPELRREAQDIEACRTASGPGDIVLLHLSIGSVVNDIFRDLPGRKAILYHNMTPPELVAGIQPQLAAHLERGREQLKRLPGVAQVVLADSRFNADELDQFGYGHVGVLPLVLDLGAVRAAPDRSTLARYDDGLVNVLFVGRCVPNKRLDDALRAFHYFQRCVEPRSRFLHAGSFAGTEQYHALLVTLGRELGIENVVFAGSVPQPELNALYRRASLFLCMSEHEGFCIPLLESMAHDVPVLAYAAAAVPETLDGAGVLFREKRFDAVAEMMGRLTRDGGLREAVVRGQRERLARYEARDLAAELKRHLTPLLS